MCILGHAYIIRSQLSPPIGSGDHLQARLVQQAILPAKPFHQSPNWISFLFVSRDRASLCSPSSPGSSSVDQAGLNSDTHLPLCWDQRHVFKDHIVTELSNDYTLCFKITVRQAVDLHWSQMVWSTCEYRLESFGGARSLDSAQSHSREFPEEGRH